MANHLITVASADGPVRISGCVAHPAESRSNNRMQFFFLNGRPIRDHALQHALGEAYRGLLTVGRYPIAFLTIEMPPELVDVNVHPTKLEVRFQDSGRIYSQLLATLRGKFLTTDLSTHVPAAAAEDPEGGGDAGQAAQLREDLVAWAKGRMSAWPAQAGEGPAGAPPGTASASGATGISPVFLPGTGKMPLPPGESSWDRRPLALTRLASLSAATGAVPASGDESRALGDRPAQALQIHNRYLVAETEEGVTIIDQHALHERILFERLGADRRRSGRDAESAGARAGRSGPGRGCRGCGQSRAAGQLGLRIEPFGGSTVLIAAFPAMLANLHPAEILHALLDRLLAGGTPPDRRDLLDDLLHTIACKAAVKAGDRLTPAEITALLEQRHLVRDAHHCPHGRPTALVFTREELDKQFKRT